MLLRIGQTDFPVDVLKQFAASAISFRIPGLSTPILIRLDSSDPEILRKVFIRREYEHSLPADPKVIVDVGANAGHSTAWLHARFPRAAIIAIEPNPRDFRILQQNCSEFPNVHLMNSAFLVNFDNDGSQKEKTYPGMNAAATQEQTITINSVLEQLNVEEIDILKLNPDKIGKKLFGPGDLNVFDRVDCVVIDCPQKREWEWFDQLSNSFRSSTNGETKFLYKKRSVIETSAGARYVWLVSDGRSGSTWLSSLLNYGQTYAEYFEPLHSMFSPQLFGEPLIAYERPGQLSEKMRDFYARIFSRKWSSPRSGPSNPGKPSVLVKDIHALLLARAVAAEFPEIEVVCLVRDPAAVAASKLTMESHGSVWFNEPVLLLRNELLQSDWLSPFATIISEARTQFQKYVILWAIMYYVISRQFDRSQITFVRYNDDKERIFEVVKRFAPVENKSLADSELAAAFNKRSRTDAPKGGAKYNPTQLELEYSREIVRSFGLEDILYG